MGEKKAHAMGASRGWYQQIREKNCSIIEVLFKGKICLSAPWPSILSLESCAWAEMTRTLSARDIALSQF